MSMAWAADGSGRGSVVSTDPCVALIRMLRRFFVSHAIRLIVAAGILNFWHRYIFVLFFRQLSDTSATSMTVNLPHMLATMLVIFIVAFALEKTAVVREASRAKRALITGGAVGLAVLILNLVWPYAPA